MPNQVVELDWWIEYLDTTRTQQVMYCSSREDGERVAKYIAFLYGESQFKGHGHSKTFKRGDK